ncbi:RNA polymerase sigma factor SigJ [Bacillus spongiae]|uniref:RNA polymerase sigma factor SigJ n=1 Tax=Bacillus spongiae TaxID=2683610 RepID=A0ABU8HJK4_9BACI
MENSLIQQFYISYKPLLFSLAYQMTGSVDDAEDIIHDVFTQLKSYELKHEQNTKAFLCKLVTNRCLDLLKSSRKKREMYVGTWLPEPFVSNQNPMNEVMEGEQISIALLLLFDSLNPVERAVFILREILEYDYKTIANIVQKSESNCRQILSRIKKELPNLQDELEGTAPSSDHEETVLEFISAFQKGDITHLIDYLEEDVIYYADGGGKQVAALRPILGKEKVINFLLFLSNKQLNENYQFFLSKVNGQIGFTIKDPEGYTAVVSFHVMKGKIKAIYYFVNPDKLKYVK